MGKEKPTAASKHGQFNREQARKEPSGGDTALMIDCNTSSTAEPESNNCCDYCTTLSHNNRGGGRTGNNICPGADQFVRTGRPNASKQRDKTEAERPLKEV